MIIIKLGGSLVTDKSKKFVIRKAVVRRVAWEIRESGALNGGLVIVHGGGSFGHPVAKEYGLDKGVSQPSQIAGVAATRNAMTKLNSFLVDALIEQSIPAVSVQTSAVVSCKGGRIARFDLEFTEKLLGSGLVPVLFGDVVVDEEMKFSILSGDQIVSFLSRTLRPNKIILATDVDGVFDKDPKSGGDANLIPLLTEKDLASINFGDRNDATGGIKGKLMELLSLARDGYEGHIINALEKERLKKALLGMEVIGTKIGVKR